MIFPCLKSTMKDHTVYCLFFYVTHNSPPAHFKNSNEVVVTLVSSLLFKDDIC